MTGTALEILASRDKDFAQVLKTFGPPPEWQREPGFGTLLHIILEQQVSLAAARAAFERVSSLVEPLTPEGFLQLDERALKEAYFSRQKIRYGRALAEALLRGELDLAALEHLPDDRVRNELTKITGIGRWTADIYLLMVLRRPDIWPVGDLALAVALQQLKNLTERPKPEALEAMAEAWRPHRSAAARLLWHYYLSR